MPRLDVFLEIIDKSVLETVYWEYLTFTGDNQMGRKQEKAQQRKTYQDSFKGVKHGHGGRSIRKKDEAALGK